MGEPERRVRWAGSHRQQEKDWGWGESHVLWPKHQECRRPWARDREPGAVGSSVQGM